MLCVMMTFVFAVTAQPLPPTNVDVCVSFDTSGNPALQIYWQVSINKHYVNVHMYIQ